MDSASARQKTPMRLPDRICAYVQDPDLCDGLARLADGYGLAMPEVIPGGVQAALGDEAPAADVVLLEIDDPTEGLEAISVLAARGKGRLVAVGRQNDVRLYRQACEAGASDYLVAPLDDGDLLAALRMPTRRAPPEQAAATAAAPKVTLMIGCRGGVGTTSFAVSTAWWAAEKLEAQTALVDLDLVFGTAALSLDLLPGRGLREAVEHPERIDPLFIGSALINATDRLFVLGAEEAPGLEILPAEAGLERLIGAVADSVPAVIVDLPRTLLPVSRPLMRRADQIVLVSDLGLGGLRDAIRLRDLVRDTAPETPLALIAVTPAGGPPAVARAEFERAYEGTVDWLIPWEPKAAAEAATAGKPLAAVLKPKHAHVRAAADVAGRAAPTDQNVAAGRKRKKWLW
jgi:pilus assembly protein CpaE